MAFEDIVISRASDHALSRLSSRLISHQVTGENLRPILYPQPTQLEPPFRSLGDIRDLRNMPDKPADIIYESPNRQLQLCRCTLVPSYDYEYCWGKADMLLRILSDLNNLCGFEIVGNSKEVKLRLLCDKSELAVISTVFSSEFPNCALMRDRPIFFARSYNYLKFKDYHPLGLYSHLLTPPSAITASVYETFLFTLSTLSKDSMGFCQVLFKGVSPRNNWHANVKVMTNAEYTNALFQTPGLAGRYPQQLPAENLRDKSLNVDTKAHPDKSFFAAAVRVGISGDDNCYCKNMLTGLCKFMNLLRHSDRALGYITNEQYGDIDTREMFEKSLVYRPGMLLNSTEPNTMRPDTKITLARLPR